MPEQSYTMTDPAMLRAFAHPMRQRILWELAVRTHARAADLAEIIGEPANSLSFHLRTLAKAGLIEEAPEHARDSRDRVWRMAYAEGVYVDPRVDEVTSRAFVDEQLGWMRELLLERLPKDEGALRGQYHGAALLTKAEASEMWEEVTEVLERWRKHGAEASERGDDARRVFHRITLLVGNRAEQPERPATA